MLPSSFKRQPQRKGMAGVPLPIALAALIGGVMLVVFIGVTLTMGISPAPEQMVAEIKL